MKNGGHVRIVIHWSTEIEWLRVTVDSILQHTDYPSYEIVISACNDKLRDVSFGDRRGDVPINVLQTEKALGAGQGRNVATQPGDATYYVFLDPHCLVDQGDWLCRAVETMQQFPEAAMIQPETVIFAYPDRLSAGDNLIVGNLRLLRYEYGVKWAWPYASCWWLSDSLAVKHDAERFEMMSGVGNVVITRAEVFHDLGKFDSEVNGPFQETMDYCIRAWLLDHPTIVDSGIRVYHREDPETGRPPKFMLSLIHGRLRTAYKYLSPRRRDMAEILFRQHGFDDEVDQALDLVCDGQWLSERVEHLRKRGHDDDWLFDKFDVYEE